MSDVDISLNGPSVFDDMPADVYHSDPAPEPSLSSGIAKLLVTASPLHAWHAHPKLNPEYEEESDGIFDRGSAAHALLLQGDDLMVECAFDDWRKKEAREMREAIRAESKLPLLSKHIAGVRRMVEVARAALLASELHATLEEFHAERSVKGSEEVISPEVFLVSCFDDREVTQIVLTIAHLDHTPENCADENLRAWCQRCHLTYDADHHAQTAYATRRSGKSVGDLFE